MTLSKKPKRVIQETLGVGRRDTASRSESLAEADPRWRRQAQEGTIRPVISGGLEYDSEGRLVNTPLTGVGDATDATLVETVNAILSFLRR